MFKKRFVLTVAVVVLSASFAWGSTPFRQNQPATREQVFQYIIPAIQGNYFWKQGASATPILPKGFPQWGSPYTTVYKILGKPTVEVEMWGIPVGIYDQGYRSFGVGYIEDRMAMVCFNASLANMDYYANLVGWARVNSSSSMSPFDQGKADPIDLRSVYFYNETRSRKYKIFAWQTENKSTNYFSDYLRVIGFKEAAHAAKVL